MARTQNLAKQLRQGGIPESVKGLADDLQATIYSDDPMELAIATCKIVNTGQLSSLQVAEPQCAWRSKRS